MADPAPYAHRVSQQATQSQTQLYPAITFHQTHRLPFQLQSIITLFSVPNDIPWL